MESEGERTAAGDTRRRDRGNIPESTVYPSVDAVGAQPSTGNQGDEATDAAAREYDIPERPVQRTQRTDSETPKRSDGVSDGDPVGPEGGARTAGEGVSESYVAGTRSGTDVDESVRADSVVDSDPDRLELPIY